MSDNLNDFIIIGDTKYIPEKTCHVIYDGVDNEHSMSGKTWHCSNCNHEMDEFEAERGHIA